MNELMKKTLVIEELGFKEEEMDAIDNYFLLFTLTFEDWNSIEFVDENEEESEHYFKLPTGRMVFFPAELLYKEVLAQID
ncbi:hypothetical protein SB717_15470 [Priestia sp. SIMBA_032]|uniref:hypothetical protein n=1 Tax=Priestia sp. SIMBA_032 TaxID=3085775 RepID=UPI00397829F4